MPWHSRLSTSRTAATRHLGLAAQIPTGRADTNHLLTGAAEQNPYRHPHRVARLDNLGPP
jgi:hypothetical protein